MHMDWLSHATNTGPAIMHVLWSTKYPLPRRLVGLYACTCPDPLSIQYCSRGQTVTKHQLWWPSLWNHLPGC